MGEVCAVCGEPAGSICETCGAYLCDYTDCYLAHVCPTILVYEGANT